MLPRSYRHAFELIDIHNHFRVISSAPWLVDGDELVTGWVVFDQETGERDLEGQYKCLLVASETSKSGTRYLILLLLPSEETPGCYRRVGGGSIAMPVGYAACNTEFVTLV